MILAIVIQHYKKLFVRPLSLHCLASRCRKLLTHLWALEVCDAHYMVASHSYDLITGIVGAGILL